MPKRGRELIVSRMNELLVINTSIGQLEFRNATTLSFSSSTCFYNPEVEYFWVDVHISDGTSYPIRCADEEEQQDIINSYLSDV